MLRVAGQDEGDRGILITGKHRAMVEKQSQHVEAAGDLAKNSEQDARTLQLLWGDR